MCSQFPVLVSYVRRCTPQLQFLNAIFDRPPRTPAAICKGPPSPCMKVLSPIRLIEVFHPLSLDLCIFFVGQSQVCKDWVIFLERLDAVMFLQKSLALQFFRNRRVKLTSSANFSISSAGVSFSSFLASLLCSSSA